MSRKDEPHEPEPAMTFFDLVLQTRSSLHPDGEPDDFISSFSGVIRAEDGVRESLIICVRRF
jgi:hypothetical protein